MNLKDINNCKCTLTKGTIKYFSSFSSSSVKEYSNRVANSEMKFVPRAFQGIFCQISGVFQGIITFYIYMIIDLLLVPFHISFCVLLEILRPLVEKEAAFHTTNDTLFYPNKLIDPPLLRYRNKKCNSTIRPKINAWTICFRT